MSWANEEFDKDVDENKIKKEIAINTAIAEQEQKAEVKPLVADISMSEPDKKINNVIDLSQLNMQNQTSTPTTKPKKISTYNPEYYKLHKDMYRNAVAKYREKQKLKRKAEKLLNNNQKSPL